MAKNRSWNVWMALLGIALLLPLGSCKKSDEIPPAQDVMLSIDVYNHTQGLIYDNYKITVQAGSMVSLTKAMFNVTGVKSEYLILRKLHSGEMPGAFVADTNMGALTVPAPNTDTDYDLFLLNDSETPYAQFWASSDTGKAAWEFFHQNWGQTGPLKPLLDAIAFMNTSLTKNCMRYGIITVLPEGTIGNQANGQVRFGYYSFGGDGSSNIVDNWWSVNSEKNYNDISKYLRAVSEGGEFLTRSNNFIMVGAADWETKYTDAICMKFLRVRN